MAAAGTTTPPTHSRGSVARGARAARGLVPREGSQSIADLGAYALPQLGRAFALRALVGLTGEGAEKRTGPLHIAIEGSWEGHPDGAFTLDRAAFESCVAAFNAQANPVPVDWEHASVRGDVEKARAAGWVQKLEIREDGLWALVEWTEEGAHDIRSGAYRYCSGVFEFGKADRRTGEPIPCCLTSAALTNTPFIDGQRPIALSQRRVALSGGTKMEIPRDALEAALKALEGDTFTESQLESLIASVAAMQAAKDPDGAEVEIEVEEPELADKPEEMPEEAALADAPMPEEHMPMAEGEMPTDPAAVMAELESIAAAMGKDVAGLIAYLREMAQAGAGADAAANPAALSAEVAALKATVQSYGKQLAKYRERDVAEEKAKRDAERRALSAEVDEMVASGVIVKADADAWRGLALTDKARFRALKSTLKPAVPTGREASAAPAQPSEAQSMDGQSLDKSDPVIRALFDRYQKNWKVNDPAKLESLVRRHLSMVSAG